MDIGQRRVPLRGGHLEEGGNLQFFRSGELAVGELHRCGIVEEDDDLAAQAPLALAGEDRLKQDHRQGEEGGDAQGDEEPRASGSDDAALVVVECDREFDGDAADRRGDPERPGCVEVEGAREYLEERPQARCG